MKIIYSLKEFREEVLKIAKLVDKDYVSVYVEIDAYEQVKFKCYVDKYGFYEAKTMEGSLAKLKEKISPIMPANIDVEIEVETEDIDLGKKAIEELAAFHGDTENDRSIN